MFSKVFVLLLAVLTHPNNGNVIKNTNRTGYDPKDFLNARIVGGIEAPPGYGDFSAALVHGDVMAFLMCGGSIITSKHILTAAHCIEPLVIWGQLMPSFRAVIGSNKWTSTENNIGFSKYSNHPDWSWNALKNDIGVLYLTEEIQFGKHVTAISLEPKWVGGGVKSYVTGWGRLGAYENVPEVLQYLAVRTLTPQQCIDGVREASKVWGSAPPVDPNIEICTFHSINHGMCNGDSGSALVDKMTGKQIGLVSWGFPCALGAPDMFVRISAYVDWINYTLSGRAI